MRLKILELATPISKLFDCNRTNINLSVLCIDRKTNKAYL